MFQQKLSRAEMGEFTDFVVVSVVVVLFLRSWWIGTYTHSLLL